MHSNSSYEVKGPWYRLLTKAHYHLIQWSTTAQCSHSSQLFQYLNRFTMKESLCVEERNYRNPKILQNPSRPRMQLLQVNMMCTTKRNHAIVYWVYLEGLRRFPAHTSCTNLEAAWATQTPFLFHHVPITARHAQTAWNEACPDSSAHD